jgi:hypothetical protein
MDDVAVIKNSRVLLKRCYRLDGLTTSRLRCVRCLLPSRLNERMTKYCSRRTTRAWFGEL